MINNEIDIAKENMMMGMILEILFKKSFS